MATTIVPSTSATPDAIIGQITELIQERELRAGDQLPPIREIAKLLGYKATAVRDSLVQAQALGLVKILPRAGAFVQQAALKPLGTSLAGMANDFGSLLECDEHNLFHLLDARQVLELELGFRAIARCQVEDLLPLRLTLDAMTSIRVLRGRSNYLQLDMQFHRQLARLGGNQVLALMLETIMRQLCPHLEHYLQQLPWDEEHQRTTNQLHVQLYQALVDGDKEAFRAGLCKHQTSAYDCLVSQVRTPPDPM